MAGFAWRPRHRVRAFTLTELAIVLGVIGMLLGGIWAVSSLVTNNNKNGLAIKEILTIAQNVRALYSTKNSIVAGDFTSGFVTAGVFPGYMVVGTTTANPWNTHDARTPNGVTVANNTGGWACSGSSENGNDLGFDIIFWGIPKSACIAILMYMTGPNAAASGVNCAYSDGTGYVAIDGSSANAIQASCSGNLGIGFNLK